MTCRPGADGLLCSALRPNVGVFDLYKSKELVFTGTIFCGQTLGFSYLLYIS